MSQGAPHPRMHGLTHVPGGPDPIPGLGAAEAEAAVPFSDAVAALAATRDLRGYWRLGEGASPYADTSGHAGGAADMVRTARGTAMTQDYNPGALPAEQDDGAVQFNASAYNVAADYLGASASRLDLAGVDYTVAGWIKPQLFSAQSLLAIGNYSPFNGGYGIFVSSALGQITWWRGDSGGTSAITGPSLPLDQWSFVACTWTLSGTVGRIYLNGTLVATGVSANGLASFGTCLIGGNSSAGSNYASFNGGVDEASVWGVALTDAEIATLAVSGGLAAAEENVIGITGAYTATASDDIIQAGAGTYTITLPSASGIAGKRLTIKLVGAGAVTIDPPGAEAWEGTASGNLTLNTIHQACTCYSDGAGWRIMSRYL